MIKNKLCSLVISFLALTPHALAETSFTDRLALAAIERTTHHIIYDGSYHAIKYPGGDVPGNIGVCSDVVIRSYRALGIDLQQRVHDDMKANFHLYPKNWGLTRPDPNIDHRRVPNLQKFFTRQGKKLPLTHDQSQYKAGDIVTWNLSPKGDLPHIGIITNKQSASGRPLVVHNIGQGPQLEDVLFAYALTGHYSYEIPAPSK